jgi:drug/metabolite transporter (DMT)-like permease
MVMSLVSVLITFIPLIVLGQSSSSADSSIFGDLVAVATGLTMSLVIFVNRAAALHDPDIYMLVGAVLGSFMCCLITGTIMAGTGTPFVPPDLTFFGVLAVDGLCVAVLLVALTLAPRTLLGVEVSLISLLETILAPLIVFFWFGEVPALWTFVGGGLLVATVVAHEGAGIHEARTLEAREARDPARDKAEPAPCYSEPLALKLGVNTGEAML